MNCVRSVFGEQLMMLKYRLTKRKPSEPSLSSLHPRSSSSMQFSYAVQLMNIRKTFKLNQLICLLLEITRIHLDAKGKKLYDQGFRFRVNLNCSRYHVEAIYSKKFMEQWVRRKCKIGEMDLKECERTVTCRSRQKFRIC